MITTDQPDIQREPYGPDQEQVFNFWRARDPGAVPALVHFNGADPDAIPPELVAACRDAGIAVASVTFHPFDRGFPLPQEDAVRAVQHIRHHAVRLGVDPRRLAVGGTSAGSGIALYCAYLIRQWRDYAAFIVAHLNGDGQGPGRQAGHLPVPGGVE